MKKYEYVIKSPAINYMTQPEQSETIQPTETKTYKKPTMTAEQIIAANQNSRPIKAKPQTDKDGLHEAYNRPMGLYIHANTLYVAGTRDVQDIYNDLKIPINQTDKALRYRNEVDLFKVNPDVSNIVGHSLGGATALELQKNFKDKNYNVNTYGAPVLLFSRADIRYRNTFDPVSMLDFGAQSSFHAGLNPHTYYTSDQHKVSDKSFSIFTYRTNS